jgi:DNA-binding CsgD family transcriptional regulator
MPSATVHDEMPAGQVMPPPGDEARGAVALVRFAQGVANAASYEDLDRVFASQFGPSMGVPMYGFNVVEAETYRVEHDVSVNVSDMFVARAYGVIAEDPVRRQERVTGAPVYNLRLMSVAEWRESLVYRHAFAIHRMDHLVGVPMFVGDDSVATLRLAASGERDFAAADLARAKAYADLLGPAIRRIRGSTSVERQRDRALLALDLTGSAVAMTDPLDHDVKLNRAARRLLAEVVDAEQCLHRVLSRPPGALSGPFAQLIEVELEGGGRGTLHGHSTPASDDELGLVTVLELKPERPSLSPVALAALTPREAEVAVEVANGLSDREIAETLCLSRHTVSQYVKRIYRKLGVDSRVALTRALLGVSGRLRRG